MNNIDNILIQQYLEGKMDPKMMHELERRALEDPFLSDAMEGLSLQRASVKSELSILQKQLEQRIAQQQEEKNVYSFSWQRLSVAAAAAVIFVAVSILFWMKMPVKPDNSSTREREIEVNILSKDRLSKEAREDKYSNSTKNQLEPAEGWGNYQEYIRSNKSKLSIETRGKVIVGFSINTKGAPEGIYIIQGIGSLQNKEAMRLVKEGPLWKVPAKGESIDGSVTIQFP